VPAYLAKQSELKAKGISEVIVYCVNDMAVMEAWAKDSVRPAAHPHWLYTHYIIYIYIYTYIYIYIYIYNIEREHLYKPHSHNNRVPPFV